MLITLLRLLAVALAILQGYFWHIAFTTPKASPTAYRGLTWYEWLLVACFLFLPLTLSGIAFKISTVV